ncbi:MAG: hypothetical protein IJR31_08255, partial [Lachnospiraceae bacterium]|nr:hypothetical protein [Lachnospiraceae bacterium]
AVRYRFNRRDDYESAGYIAYSDYSASRGPALKDNEEALSDDGRYSLFLREDHTVEIFEDGSDTPVSTLYDVHGTFTGLKSLNGTGYYVLTGYNTSYLLNDELEIIAALPGFYDYDEKRKALILFRNSSFSSYDDLIYVPLREYDDLIREADELLSGYEPSAETRERYRMLDD